MKIRIKGEMTLVDLRQCLFEQLHTMEDRFAVRHTDDVTLYLNLTNGFGAPLVCRDDLGREVKSLNSAGPYRPAAIRFDLF